MLGKTKNLLFNLYKKKAILFVFFFSFFGLTFARSASAGWVADLGTFIVTRPFFGIAWVLTQIGIGLVGLAGNLLNWVLSPSFISYSYTNPGGPNANPIIETGLGVTQGFVNMLLVLILVYIAIATILRLAGYETKKLLITFIVVALLVNFAPVICGLIVDASNIIMNFFVQDLEADTFGTTMGNKVTEISAGFEWLNIDGAQDWGSMFQLIVMAGFLFVLSFILSLFTILFTLRYLVIWLLVILSPLAFACYILPITKKYFDKWWEQFINWSFIGISCSFFLYLGLLLVTKIQSGAAVASPTTGQGGLFDSVLPYFVSVVFLGIGFVFGLQTSAIGASTVISAVKKGQKASTKWTRRAAGRGIKQQVERLKTKEAAHKITKAVERVPIARWFLPEAFRKYGEFRPAIDAEQKRLEPYSSREISHRLATKADIGVRAMGGMMELIKRGDMQDMVNAFKKKYYGKRIKKGEKVSDEELFKNEKFLKELKAPIGAAFSGGYHSKLLRSDPRLAKAAWFNNLGPFADKKEFPTAESAVKQATSEARRTHINQWEREVLEDETVVDGLMERGREVFEAIDVQVKRGQKTTLETIDKLFSEYLKKQNPGLTSEQLKQKFGDSESDATKDAWKGFGEVFKKEHKGNEGYFRALDSTRFTDRGWRIGRYEEPGTPPATPTAGEATMGSPPSPTPSTGGQSGKRPNIPRTGKEGKKTSNIPTTGKGGKRKQVESKVVESKPLKKEPPS